jgi:hypothetical protein
MASVTQKSGTMHIADAAVWVRSHRLASNKKVPAGGVKCDENVGDVFMPPSEDVLGLDNNHTGGDGIGGSNSGDDIASQGLYSESTGHRNAIDMRPKISDGRNKVKSILVFLVK